MTNPHEPVTPHSDGTLRFSDGSQLKVGPSDRPKVPEHLKSAGCDDSQCEWHHGVKVGPSDRPKCPWCGDVGCELHDMREAWRLGHDTNCNVRVAFPSTEEDCNCHSPAAPNEIERQLAAERRKVQQLQDTLRAFELPEPKPPRIRTLELPGEINPNTHELSVVFAIILDRMGDTTVDDNQLDRLADETGARTAVSFPFEIQIGED